MIGYDFLKIIQNWFISFLELTLFEMKKSIFFRFISFSANDSKIQNANYK